MITVFQQKLLKNFQRQRETAISSPLLQKEALTPLGPLLITNSFPRSFSQFCQFLAFCPWKKYKLILLQINFCGFIDACLEFNYNTRAGFYAVFLLRGSLGSR